MKSNYNAPPELLSGFILDFLYKAKFYATGELLFILKSNLIFLNHYLYLKKIYFHKEVLTYLTKPK